MGNELHPSIKMQLLLSIAVIAMCLLLVALGKRCMAFYYQVLSTDIIRMHFKGEEGSTYKPSRYWSQGSVSLPTQ